MLEDNVSIKMPQNQQYGMARGGFLTYLSIAGLAIALGLASPQEAVRQQATVATSSLEAKAASQTSSPSDLSTQELMTLDDLRKFARQKYVFGVLMGKIKSSEDKPIIYSGIIDGKRVEIRALSPDTLDMKIFTYTGRNYKNDCFDYYFVDSGIKGHVLRSSRDIAAIYMEDTMEHIQIDGYGHFRLSKLTPEERKVNIKSCPSKMAGIVEGSVEISQNSSPRLYGTYKTIYADPSKLVARLKEEVNHANNLYKSNLKKVIEDFGPILKFIKPIINPGQEI